MTFAAERDIRNEAFLKDFDEVPSELLTHSLAKAHQEILRETILTGESTLTDEIVRAESILTVSYLFRSMAVSSAVSAQDWKASGLHVAGHLRVTNLLDMADRLWDDAWGILRPYSKHTQPSPLTLVQGDET